VSFVDKIVGKIRDRVIDEIQRADSIVKDAKQAEERFIEQRRNQ
jgi:hypothetical protein